MRRAIERVAQNLCSLQCRIICFLLNDGAIVNYITVIHDYYLGLQVSDLQHSLHALCDCESGGFLCCMSCTCSGDQFWAHKA